MEKNMMETWCNKHKGTCCNTASCCCCWSLLYSAILHSWADSLRSHVILRVNSFFKACFWISTKVVYLQRQHSRCHMKLLPFRHILCTLYKHAPRHFMQSHTRKVHAYLAVTCHLHFWQNYQDLVCATVVTRGGMESRPWSRKFSSCSCRDSNPQPFTHKSGTLTIELSPLWVGSGNSSIAEYETRGFESWLKQREIFLLWGQLSVIHSTAVLPP